MTNTDLTDRIRARRAALAAQMEQAQQQYSELEQTLALLQRNIDAMHGGVQELDALLAELEKEEHA
jgi:septation ring formation regulator EzrA